MSLKVIFGLGNPGAEYNGTRHNLGFDFLDALAKEFSFSWKWDKKMNAEIAEGIYLEQKLTLVKPQTFMNLSGVSVLKFTDYFKIAKEDILVVYDDYNLEFGLSKLKIGGGDGGHNGISNIILQIGADFPRFRLGIKPKCKASVNLSNFVLGSFDPSEVRILEQKFPHWLKSIELVVDKGIDIAMNHTNKKNAVKNEQDRD